MSILKDTHTIKLDYTYMCLCVYIYIYIYKIEELILY